MDGLVWIIVALAWAALWCYQFVMLMMMEDGLFPGTSDKLIWGLCFVLAAPLAPFVFVFWRKAMLEIKE